MKKFTSIALKALTGFILLILILLFTLPLLFKDKIRTTVGKTINESVNANVKFDNYKLSFFKNFPNLSFALNGLSVTGVDKFESDTLAAFRSFNLVFDLSSLFKRSGYEINSIIIDQAVINAIVLKDSSVNWDIMKDEDDAPEEETDTTSSDLMIHLRKFKILNSSVSYIDHSADMAAYLKNLDFSMKGDMTADETDMLTLTKIGELTFIMEGVKYLNRAVVESEIELLADLKNFKFTLGGNYLLLNDLKLNFSGTVSMPDDDIETDIMFGAEQTSLKNMLSLVPAVYMSGYEDLTTTGDFKLNGYAKGIYSDADSTMPDIGLDMSLSNGVVSYPDLPEQISNINIKSVVFVDGKDMDKTIADISLFHFELAGNPFDMTFSLKTPMSDPDFKSSFTGKIDLTALTNAIPLDSITLSGIIDMSVSMAGRMSMIEKEQYDRFHASGNMGIRNMLVAMTGYPEVNISEALFGFTPAFATMDKAIFKVGDRSDFSLTGRLSNYIPYIFNNETIRGNISLRSDLVDLSDILAGMAVDTTEIEDTTALAVIKVPENIDFDFDALINSFIYDNIRTQNVKGHIIARGGILSIKDAGMNILGGTITMNAGYDTRDTLKPMIKADFKMNAIGVKDAFNTFNTIQKLAPAAKGMDGKINLQINYESLLGTDMMPLLSTASGGGKLQSDEITLVESVTYDRIKDVLKLGENYSNTFKDLNISFSLREGRVYIDPFDTRVGNIKMNISGDQGLDQTLNYLVKTEIPRADLGSSVNSMIDNLSAQAAAFGISYKPADILKVNVKITGVFGKPLVMPQFGSGSGASQGGIVAGAGESVKQLASDAVDTGKDKLRQEAEAQGDKLINEAEMRGQQLRDEAARTAEKLRQEAEVQAKKIEEAAASKGSLAKLAAQKSADAIRKEADNRANALIMEADNQADKLVEEAKAKKEELINKI